MKKVENPIQLVGAWLVEEKINCGGSWYSDNRECRATCKDGVWMTLKSEVKGFRPILRALRVRNTSTEDKT